MGTQTGITWADATWNPWTGCTPVSEGCQKCYARRDMTRYGKDFSTVKQSSAKTFNLPLAKKRDGSWKIPDGSFVFVCSWSDFFHEDVHPVDQHAALALMMLRPGLTFLLLTKRPREMQRCLERVTSQGAPNDLGLLQVDLGQVSSEFRDVNGCGIVTESWLMAVMDEEWPPRHIWLGVTAENQARADERIPKLLEIDWPGKKFVSVEPMLGPVRLYASWIPCPRCNGRGWYLERFSDNHATPCQSCVKVARDAGYMIGDGQAAVPGSRLDWTIVGGESGPNARPMKLEWARSLRDQCQAAGVAFHMKQLGGWPDKRKNLEDLPEDLRIRERP